MQRTVKLPQRAMTRRYIINTKPHMMPTLPPSSAPLHHLEGAMTNPACAWQHSTPAPAQSWLPADGKATQLLTGALLPACCSYAIKKKDEIERVAKANR